MAPPRACPPDRGGATFSEVVRAMREDVSLGGSRLRAPGRIVQSLTEEVERGSSTFPLRPTKEGTMGYEKDDSPCGGDARGAYRGERSGVGCYHHPLPQRPPPHRRWYLLGH